jgi:hypothetical protein
MAKNVYLQVEFKSGNLFEYSKDQKDGFEEHVNTKNKISYRRYIKEGVYGVYRGTVVKESPFGKEVSIHMIDENQVNFYITIPLFDQSKNISSYAEDYIATLPAMEMNYVYRIFPYSLENDGRKRYGVSVRHADMHDKTVREDYILDKLTFSYTKKNGESFEGDIPEIVWEEDYDGSMKKNCTERNKYLYNVLMKYASEKTVAAGNKVTKDEPPKPYTGNFTSEKESYDSVKNDSKDSEEAQPKPEKKEEKATPTKKSEAKKPAPTKEQEDKPSETKVDLPF